VKAYLDIVKNVLDNGKWKSNRTGIRTLALPNLHFSHDMSDGFPLLTTKKMAFRSMCVELEGFLRGITSKSWYRSNNCKFWDFWANPLEVRRKLEYGSYGYTAQQLKDENFDHIKDAQLKEDSLGAFYAHQLRRFGEALDEHDDAPLMGSDQLRRIVHLLHTNPNDRRMVVSYWNPNQLHNTALPSCHYTWCLTHIDGVLNLHWTQRSVDTCLGLPINIAHYGLLLLLLCKEANLQPGNLSGTLCDCHIYENHIPGAKEQLKRTPGELPQIELNNWSNIFNWTHKDVKLTNYNPCPKINFGEIAV